MGLQKYRADEAHVQVDGSVAWYARWMGGPSLAKVTKCRVTNADIPPRTVYITGEADTWFSLPAACRYKGRTIRGYVSWEDGALVFRAHKGQNLPGLP